METKSIERINTSHPLLRERMLEAYNDAVKATPVGVHPYVDQVYRTFAESDALYAKGRNKDGKIVNKNKVVTNAPGGASYHNYGLALDFHLQVNGKDIWPDEPTKDKNWMKVVEVFKSHGFSWGGDWKSLKDYPHFEYSFGYSVSKLKALHDAGKVDKDGYVIIKQL